MIRVLHVVSSLGSGGVEALLYNYYISMDRSKIKFDFIVHGEKIGKFEEKFLELGSKIYHVTPRKENPLKNVFQMKRVFKQNDYDIIHTHLEYMAFIPLYFGKQKAIKTRIVHAHLSNKDNGNFLKRMCILILKKATMHYGTHYFGCSEDALEDLFGKDITLNGDSMIIKNAIDLKDFSYDMSDRISLRTQLGIDGNFVIGHIGRFTEQKNHNFIIDIFKEITKVNKDAKLILVGEGPLRNDVKKKVNDYGLTNNVMFLGVRDDINQLMNSFDVFLFPSNYEGLGIVLIEAQACSLHSFTSDKVVPQEAKVSKYIKYLSLEKPPEFWAEKINDYSKGYVREFDNKSVRDAGYDVEIQSAILQEFYSNRCADYDKK